MVVFVLLQHIDLFNISLPLAPLTQVLLRKYYYKEQ